MKIYIHFKNILDWITAFFLLILCSPILCAAAIAIRAEDGGPAMLAQVRTGQYMRRFRCYKFRTMKSADVEFDKNNPVISGDNGNVTKVGRILRKFKIDELPQLFNVLRGEMSLISPRPLLPVYEADYQDWECVKFLVKPGITGLGQISGNGYLEIADRNYYDALYVMDLSFGQDLKIFFKTIGVIFCGEEKFIRRVTPAQRIVLRDRIDRKYKVTRAAFVPEIRKAG